MKPPIADPNETPSAHFVGEDVRVFRVRFWPCCLATFLGVAWWELPVIAAIIYPTFALHPERFLPAMALMTVATAGLTVVICALWNWLAPLRVGVFGIQGTSFWSVPTEAAWSQISDVRYRWLFYPCAVISTQSGRRIWIVWLLQDPRGFAQSVAQHTAPGHPLHQFLRQRGLLG